VRPRLVRDEYDDEGDYIPSRGFAEQIEQPEDLAGRQAEEAKDYLDQIVGGKHLRFLWPDLDHIVGPLLPGWLVAVGGRGKAGKTTFLRECLTHWVQEGKKIVYVGTETEASVLRLAWAATRIGIPVEDALDPRAPADVRKRLLADVATQTNTLAYHAIFGECRNATMGDLAYWVEYARVGKADALIFDHLHRLELGNGEQWQALGSAIRQIKNMAVQSRMVVVVGAQLTQGEGGSWLGEHEVPGNGSWAGSSNIQRECDVGLQLWRPFKPGITGEEKRGAREDATKVNDLIQQNVMALRVSAHRYRGSAMNKTSKLYVEKDTLHSWTPRTP
jgi:hypothetical protein